MANWVNGYIIPYGTKEQIEKFTEYITEKKEWSKFINKNCPPKMKENEIHIYDRSAFDPVLMTEELEEVFRDINFNFFVCDEMNGVGWRVVYENRKETIVLMVEDPVAHDHLIPEQESTNEVTDEFIAHRKELHKKLVKEELLPY